LGQRERKKEIKRDRDKEKTEKRRMATADLLRKLYPHAMSPFIANAPMYGSADAGLAAAVTRAGGYSM
jgi:hypothetical protein